MDFTSHLVTISALLLLLYSLFTTTRRKRNSQNAAPPQPSGAWPIIGHLPSLAGAIPLHRALASLADKYGPVFTVRLGVRPAVVVSSADAVKECFTTNDKFLASRPPSTLAEYLGFNYAAFAFTQGPYWREMRKIVLLEVLSPRRLEKLRSVRETEIATSIGELYGQIQAATPGAALNMSNWIEKLTLNIILRKIAGKRYMSSEEAVGARPVSEVIKEFMYLSGQFVVSDLIPFPPLRWMDLGGHVKAMKRVSGELSVVCERWIDDHVNGRRISSEQDFIDVMLSVIDDKYTGFGHSRDTIIKATVSNLILAGADTTSINLTWILSALLNNKHVLKQAQEEIDSKIGKERWAEESDVKNLVYLQAVVKEAIRLFPPAPLSIPHMATEDCYISGYRVLKGTQLLVNVWKLHRDPVLWPEPEKFLPERFLMTSHSDIDFTGHQHGFIPFGSGRRSCPGVNFATQVVHLTMARLLQGFEFKTPSDGPVEMKEGLGITLPKATPLEVIITPRLSAHLYQN